MQAICILCSRNSGDFCYANLILRFLYNERQIPVSYTETLVQFTRGESTHVKALLLPRFRLQVTLNMDTQSNSRSAPQTRGYSAGTKRQSQTCRDSGNKERKVEKAEGEGPWQTRYQNASERQATLQQKSTRERERMANEEPLRGEGNEVTADERQTTSPEEANVKWYGLVSSPDPPHHALRENWRGKNGMRVCKLALQRT